MNLAFPLCLFGSHKPHRNDVREVHRELVCHCKRCGLSIKRRGHRDWIRDPDRAANLTLKRH